MAHIMVYNLNNTRVLRYVKLYKVMGLEGAKRIDVEQEYNFTAPITEGIQ